MHTVESDKQKVITISLELYDHLREFCDKNGIRFLDFLEESLESATRRHELEALLNDRAKVNEKIKYKQEAAYLEGFGMGVMIALLLANGQLEPSRQLTPAAVKMQPRYEVVTGEQMKLF